MCSVLCSVYVSQSQSQSHAFSSFTLFLARPKSARHGRNQVGPARRVLRARVTKEEKLRSVGVGGTKNTSLSLSLSWLCLGWAERKRERGFGLDRGCQKAALIGAAAAAA